MSVDERFCLYCKKTYIRVRTNPTQKYCSNECRKNSQKGICHKDKEIKICKTCGMHFEKKKSTTGNYCSLSCSSKGWMKEKRFKKIIENKCICCDMIFILTHEKSKQKFCSIECKNKSNPKGYKLSSERTFEQRENYRRARIKFIENATTEQKQKYSKKRHIAPEQKAQIAIKRRETAENKRKQKGIYLRPRCYYDFKFNIFDFPDLFDLQKLQEIGFYSTGRNGKKKNLKGLSRDHRVSINEARLNDYNYYYITHPLNCELMTIGKNCSKHLKSSLTYEELIKLVDEYDNNKK